VLVAKMVTEIIPIFLFFGTNIPIVVCKKAEDWTHKKLFYVDTILFLENFLKLVNLLIK